MPKLNHAEAIERAVAAYRRSGSVTQPEAGGEVETVAGVDYVVLRNIKGILKVYQLTDDSRIKGLTKIPPGL